MKELHHAAETQGGRWDTAAQLFQVFAEALSGLWEKREEKRHKPRNRRKVKSQLLRFKLTLETTSTLFFKKTKTFYIYFYLDLTRKDRITYEEHSQRSIHV